MQAMSFSSGDAQVREAPPFELSRRARFVDGADALLDRAYRLAGLLLGNAVEAARGRA
jgi:hypothetical protein